MRNDTVGFPLASTCPYVQPLGVLALRQTDRHTHRNTHTQRHTDIHIHTDIYTHIHTVGQLLTRTTLGAPREFWL